ncbi:hypothetical protein CEXT_260051 [Caerostris extrusa]|uniref:Uncharacterized protein n=1 Tax=Caerostris extrusa TaxID=172846 RepID=A0AAV4VRE5_CAEEX|nr:hypothetical protein CEXT_260051 [Caerostris extrusa]
MEGNMIPFITCQESAPTQKKATKVGLRKEVGTHVHTTHLGARPERKRHDKLLQMPSFTIRFGSDYTERMCNYNHVFLLVDKLKPTGQSWILKPRSYFKTATDWPIIDHKCRILLQRLRPTDIKPL